MSAGEASERALSAGEASERALSGEQTGASAADAAIGDAPQTGGSAADAAIGDVPQTGGSAADAAIGDAPQTGGSAADAAIGDAPQWHEMREPLHAYLDSFGLPPGELVLTEIGEGHSNLTFLVRRGGERVVLRRPPYGPLAPSANDVLREARVLSGLHRAGARVPEVLSVCEQPDVIGVPFFLMGYVEGHVLIERIPDELDGPDAPARVCDELIDTLAEIHAVDLEQAGLTTLGRRDGYLERQLRRFGGLLEHNATRPLPELERVAGWLEANMPASQASTLVHGDYRLGNLMFERTRPRVIAVFDWEMSTLGDPLADLGYCTATWAQPGEPGNPLFDISGVTRGPGFPNREQLAQRYAAATGLSVDALRWYQALAIWKVAILLEGSYARFLEGASSDPFFARLVDGVPALARLAAQLSEAA
jgi:aminoglycoside phosphotransferase (APT) family kinase protein